jgi:hypothetical protein
MIGICLADIMQVESIVTLNILDVNEPPSFSDVTDITVSENTAMGEVIGTVTTVDFDIQEEQLLLSITKGSTDFVITDTFCSQEVHLKLFRHLIVAQLFSVKTKKFFFTTSGWQSLNGHGKYVHR